MYWVQRVFSTNNPIFEVEEVQSG
uniref:Uncharacterized protein n=1 Tax=Anguilla anguilla TaxID=7936 RepID=A0A0E9T2R0_ANGAN